MNIEKQFVCRFCEQTNHQTQWLWLAINAEGHTACLACAIQNQYYCGVHKGYTIDLIDGKCCRYCVDEAISKVAHNQAYLKKLYQKVSLFLNKPERDSLPSWVNFARLEWNKPMVEKPKPLPRYRALYWMLQAKAQRCHISLEQVIADFFAQKSLTYLVPLWPQISINSLEELYELIAKTEKDKKEGQTWPAHYPQFLFHLKVAQLKKSLESQSA